MPLDLHEIFGLNVSGFELFVRTTIIYLGLLGILRFFGRREAGSLEMPDLLMIVLIADGVQNGMSGRYNSVTGAMIVGGTIIGWNWLLTFAQYRSAWIRRLVQPEPLLLVKDGRFVRRNMRREFITSDEIASMLRAEGVYDLGDVAEAFLEPNGQMSVKTRDGGRHRAPVRSHSGAH